MFVPPTYFMLMNIVPYNMRSTSIGVFSAISGIIGSFGPYVVGQLNNFVSIKWSMFIVVNFSFIVATLGLFILILFIRNDIKKVEEYNKNFTENENQI
jgi:MFS family permease